MEHHVFAVWDFMSLLKTLQQQMCCTNVPWIPNSSSFACRLVNEIVLGEESDEDGEGAYVSHFEMYCRAMKQCGADTSSIDDFVSALKRGEPVASALRKSKVKEPAVQFVKNTFEIIESRDICAIASAFTFGREDLLPDVFRKIIEELHNGMVGSLDRFRYYLDRHIAVDGDSHGPMAERIVEHLCGNDSGKWKVAESAAIASLQSRLNLWNSVADTLN